jgi:APA family basic amino acid/polyamine antiporter
MADQQDTGIGWKTATAIVVANMIGTGVFTSLGFQLVTTSNTWSILLLWVLGAVMALCGAVSYAELGTHLIRSGGEYHFLSESYHPLIGYLSGWVSLTIGFAAPVALAGMALGEYTTSYLGISAAGIAISVVLLMTIFHSISIRTSSQVQNLTTVVKLLLILGFILAGFWLTPSATGFEWGGGWQDEIFLPAFAVSFVYVTFSYSGWNAAAYIVEEIKEVQKNLPRALVLGTLLVSILYVLLNVVFLRQSPVRELAGQLEVGQVVAINMFGEAGGQLISMAIGLMLISSVSAMIWAGPRVTQVMAEDHRLWRWFAGKKKGEIPLRATWLQTLITLVLIATGTFEQVLIYSGFVLQLFAALAVGAVFIIRIKATESQGFKSPLYPLPQLLFILLSIWVLTYLLYAQPQETGWGLFNLFIGFLTFGWSQFLEKRKGKLSV